MEFLKLSERQSERMAEGVLRGACRSRQYTEEGMGPLGPGVFLPVLQELGHVDLRSLWELGAQGGMAWAFSVGLHRDISKLGSVPTQSLPVLCEAPSSK